jgi:hypothetical protein
MKQTFVPSACTDQQKPDGTTVPAAYQGTVTLSMPTYDERLDLYDGVDVDDDEKDPKEEGISDAEKKARLKAQQRSGLRRMRTVARKAGGFVADVAIVRVEDGHRFTSWDEVNRDTELAPGVVPDVVTRLIGKFEVGKGASAG